MKALVTGAARGLGRAFAELVVSRGGTVVALDRDAAGLAELEYLYPREITTRWIDLADTEAVEALTRDIARHFRFDVVLLNAGISATGRFEDVPAEAYERLFAVNVTAPLLMLRWLVGDGAVKRGATVVFVSSLSHRLGYPGAAAYAASKDALADYAEAVRRPLLRRGVRVLSVFPGPVRTEHAGRHAPPGARADRRMAPAVLARKIRRAVRTRKRRLYPGAAAKCLALLGTMAPGLATRLMRRAVFDRLERAVW